MKHPSKRELGAWFDGEVAPGVGDHIRDCRRCRARTQHLVRVRAAVRGEPVPRGSGVRTLLPRFVPRGVAPAVAVVLVVLLAAGNWGTISQPITVGSRYLMGDTSPPAEAPAQGTATTTTARNAAPPARTTGSASAPARAAEPAPAAPSGDAAPPPVPFSAPPAAGPSPSASLQEYASGSLPATPPDSQPLSPLRLGAFVPADGFDAGEGRQVARALRRAVDAANEAGGVAGRRVELVVVPAEDKAAVDALPGEVDVIVGGFGAALPPSDSDAGTDRLWLFPADPHAEGLAVVSAELSPADAGTRLGADVVEREGPGTVGVVLGSGPDRGLAEGLGRVAELTVTSVEADKRTSCGRELATLRSRGVVAVAIAGPPELAARCADARTRLAWSPRGGLLVPPSAAYDHLEVLPTAAGARTVLGLPWPNEDHPGAARYRAAVPGPSSYRALVSYAGVELAVQVARAKGTVTFEDVMSGHWTSDLADFEATRRAATIVEVTLGRWERDGRRSHRSAGAGQARSHDGVEAILPKR